MARRKEEPPPFKAVTLQVVADCLAKIGRRLEAEDLQAFQSYINSLIEYGNYLLVGRGRKELPHQYIKRLQSLQKAAADLFAVWTDGALSWMNQNLHLRLSG